MSHAKSAVAENKFQMAHKTEYSKYPCSGYSTRLCRLLNNMDGGFNLSWSWWMVTNTIQQYWAESIQRQDQLMLSPEHGPEAGIQMVWSELYFIPHLDDESRYGPWNIGNFHLTQLIAPEGFITFSHFESFRSYTSTKATEKQNVLLLIHRIWDKMPNFYSKVPKNTTKISYTL